MDMNAENLFINQVGKILKDSTMLIVTHRMPLLNLVDRIIVMNEGQIVEDGPKDEIIQNLISKGNVYKIKNILSTPKPDIILYVILIFLYHFLFGLQMLN